MMTAQTTARQLLQLIHARKALHVETVPDVGECLSVTIAADDFEFWQPHNLSNLAAAAEQAGAVAVVVRGQDEGNVTPIEVKHLYQIVELCERTAG